MRILRRTAFPARRCTDCIALAVSSAARPPACHRHRHCQSPSPRRHRHSSAAPSTASSRVRSSSRARRHSPRPAFPPPPSPSPPPACEHTRASARHPRTAHAAHYATDDAAERAASHLELPSRAFAADGLLWDDHTAALVGHEPRHAAQAEAAAEQRERAALADFERRNFWELSDYDGDASLLPPPVSRSSSRSDSSGASSARSSRHHSPLALHTPAREQLHTLEVLALVLVLVM